MDNDTYFNIALITHVLFFLLLEEVIYFTGLFNRPFFNRPYGQNRNNFEPF